MNTIAIAVGCLVALLVVLFVGVQLYAYGWLLLDNLRLGRRLRAQHRVRSLDEAKERIKLKLGIVIVDDPSLGWNISRVWWSPTTDFEPRPESWSKDLLCPDEDITNYDKFIEPSSGTALLVDGFVFSQRIRAYLKQHFGSDKFGYVFSGGVLNQAALEKNGQMPVGIHGDGGCELLNKPGNESALKNSSRTRSGECGSRAQSSPLSRMPVAYLAAPS